MLNKPQIVELLQELSENLAEKDLRGEICLYGGTVMCLVYDARPSTKDVDAIFHPAKEIRQAAEMVARKRGLPHDWLNDAVKGFLAEHPKKVFMDLPALRVYVPAPDYLLAMKAMAARVDATDKDDVRILLKILKVQSAEEAFAMITKYYPHEQIRPATQYFLEEIFQQ